MAISFENADYIRGTGVINIGTTSVVNLNVLGTTNATSGTGLTSSPYTTLISRPEDNGDDLNVGETFTLTRSVKPGRTGTSQSFELTMRGTGTYTPLIGSEREIIVAESSEGQQFIIFPNSDTPSGLLGTVGSLAVNLSTQPVGYDFGTLSPLCFTRGTMIETPEGPRPIETLAEGDLVLTRDHGPQPVRWIGSRVLTGSELARHHRLRPILIRAGALGDGLPAADLRVSPQHRILIRSKVAQKMFGTSEILAAAKQLLQVDGIDICDDIVQGVEYFHMLFERHEVVVANGAETESLFTGPEAIKTVGPEALEEIYEILPQLRDRDHRPIGARALASGRMSRKLVSRHVQHRKPLVAAL